jgi:internalin A
VLSGNRPLSFEPLRGLSKLRRLGLNDTGFGDADLEIIKGLTALTELDLEDNEAFTAAGLEELQNALPNCTVKHSPLYFTVTLGSQVFTSDMREIRAESVGVTSLQGLEKFSLLNSLILNGNSISELSPLSELFGLETLELSDNAIADVSALKKLTALKRLTLNKNRISDISALSELRELTVLNLEDNQISDPTPIYALTKLRTLYIGKNENLSAEQLVALQEALPACSIQTDLDLTRHPPRKRRNRKRRGRPKKRLSQDVTLHIVLHPCIVSICCREQAKLFRPSDAV